MADHSQDVMHLSLTPEEVAYLLAAVQFAGAFAPGQGMQKNSMKMYSRLLSLRLAPELARPVPQPGDGTTGE